MDFFSQNSNCSLSTFFSRPRAEVPSFHQHVEKGNECHKCICFQTCDQDTRDDTNSYTTIFFTLPSMDKGYSVLVAGLAFRLFELSRQSVPSPSVLKRVLALGEISLRLPLLSTIVSRRPVACVSLLEQDSNLQFSDQCKICFCPFPFITSLCANFCSELHDPALKFCSVREFCRCISEWRKLGIVMQLEYKSKYPRHG